MTPMLIEYVKISTTIMEMDERDSPLKTLVNG